MKILVDFALWQKNSPADLSTSIATLDRLRHIIVQLRTLGIADVHLSLNGGHPASTETLRHAFADIVQAEAIRTCWQLSGEDKDPLALKLNPSIRECFVAHLAPDIVLHPLHEDTPCESPNHEEARSFYPREYILSVSTSDTILETCRLSPASGSNPNQNLPRRLASTDDFIAAIRNFSPSGSADADTLENLLSKTCSLLSPCDRALRVEGAWAMANNHRAPRNPVLYVDISGIVRRDVRTGIERVTRGIVSELLKLTNTGYTIRPVYATDYELGYRHADSYVAKTFGAFSSDESDDPIAPCAGDIFMGLDFDAHITCVQEPYLRYLFLHGLRVYFLVHDLLPVTNPEWFPPGVHEGHKKWLEIISRFSGAVCVSKTVADKLTSWRATHAFTGDRRPYQIAFSHNAADIKNSAPSTGLPDNIDHLLSAWSAYPTFLMVGTVEPRKGYRQILKTFELLWAAGHKLNLVIVGKQGWHMEDFVHELQHSTYLNRMLFWPAHVSDEFLEKIYAASTCLIAASHDEGFGLPLIEAAMHELQIIARDIPIFREVAGDHAFYFTGLDPDDLATAILDWLVLRADNRQPLSTNLPCLSWRQSAEGMLRALAIQS